MYAEYFINKKTGALGYAGEPFESKRYTELGYTRISESEYRLFRLVAYFAVKQVSD